MIQRVQRYRLRVTTNTEGAATVETQAEINGRILQIHYVKPASGGFDDGHTMTFTGAETGIPVLIKTGQNASGVLIPGQPVHAIADGAVVTGAVEFVWLANEKLKLVVAGGGNETNATYYVYVG